MLIKNFSSVWAMMPSTMKVNPSKELTMTLMTATLWLSGLLMLWKVIMWLLFNKLSPSSRNTRPKKPGLAWHNKKKDMSSEQAHVNDKCPSTIHMKVTHWNWKGPTVETPSIPAQFEISWKTLENHREAKAMFLDTPSLVGNDAFFLWLVHFSEESAHDQEEEQEEESDPQETC
jgi:hypothetical protein